MKPDDKQESWQRAIPRIGLLACHIYPYIGDYLSELIPAAAIAAERNGHKLMLHTNSAANNPETLLRMVRTGELDGALVWADHAAEEILLLLNEDFPFILLGRRATHPEVSYIAPDNFAGALQLVRHLIECGHQRIAFITCPEYGETHLDRLNGYQQALFEARIPIDDALIIHVTMETQSGYRAMHTLLDLTSPPTAVIAFNDLIALEACSVAFERHLSVPAQVALAGFDGLRAGATHNPAITTVQQPLAAMARRAVDMLCGRMENAAIRPVSEVFPMKLVRRESTVG